MKLSRNPYVAAGAFVVLFLLLLRAGPSGDLVLRAVIGAAIVLMSLIVLVRAIRRRDGQTGGFRQDAAMPEKIRR